MQVSDRDAKAIWLRLTRVAQRIGRAGQDDLARHGLSPAQFQVLRRVAQEPGVTQQAVATGLEVTRGNVSQLVNRLEAAGLLVRRPAGAAYHLALTPEGSRLARELAGDYDRFLARSFAALSQDEGRTLLALLRKVDQGLSAERED